MKLQRNGGIEPDPAVIVHHHRLRRGQYRRGVTMVTRRRRAVARQQGGIRHPGQVPPDERKTDIFAIILTLCLPNLSSATVFASSMVRSSCITFSPEYPPPQFRALARSFPAQAPSHPHTLTHSHPHTHAFSFTHTHTHTHTHQCPGVARRREGSGRPGVPLSPAVLRGPNQTYRPHPQSEV